MKIVKEHNPDAVKHTDSTKKLGIDAEGMKFVMNSVINLYSREAEAALREALSNAIDSHNAAGSTEPVRVFLPFRNSGNPELVVRDFGLGLDAEGLEKAFGSFGYSTKRDTNAAIGRFGLGAKSGLAISDHFFVDGTYNGERHYSRLSIDEEGEGGLDILRSAPVDAPNGVEVRIPVKNNDLAVNVLQQSRFFLGYDLEKIHFFGNPGQRILPDDVASVYNSHFTTLADQSGTDFGWVSGDGDYAENYIYDGLYAVIGGVSYRIDKTQFADDSAVQLLSAFKRMVVLNIPIGTVKLTPSREELSYNTRTKNTIQIYADRMKELLSLLYRKEVSELATREDVIRHVNNLKEQKLWVRNVNFFWKDEDYSSTKTWEKGDFVRVSRERFEPKLKVSEPKSFIDYATYLANGKPYLMIVNSEAEKLVTVEWLRRRLSRFRSAVNRASISVYVFNKENEVADKWLTEISIVVTQDSINKTIKEFTKEQAAAKALTSDGTTPTKAVTYYWGMSLADAKANPDKRTSYVPMTADDLAGKKVVYLYKKETMGLLVSRMYGGIPNRTPNGANDEISTYLGHDEVVRTMVLLLSDHILVPVTARASIEKFRKITGLTEDDEVSKKVKAVLQQRVENVDSALLTGGQSLIQRSIEVAFGSAKASLLYILKRFADEFADQHPGFALLTQAGKEAGAEEAKVSALKAACKVYSVEIPAPSEDVVSEHVAVLQDLRNKFPLLTMVFSAELSYQSPSSLKDPRFNSQIEELKFYVKAALER